MPSNKKTGQADNKQGFTSIISLLQTVYADLEQRSGKLAKITGMTTGFKSLDERTDGFHRGEVMLVGARPITGKSALIANLAVRAAMSNDQSSVAMISADLPVKQMFMRMMALEAKIELERLRTERLESGDWQQLTEASGRLGKAILMMDKAPPSLPVMHKNLADIKHGDTGLDIVLVDDLQSLAESMGIKHSSKGIASLMRGLHTIARNLDVAVIVTARLNATVESRADKRPRMTDLYQSRAIEPKADVITLLYRDEMYHRRPEYEGLMEIIMDHTDVEMRYLTKDFPNLALPNKRAVCPIEIDATALSKDGQYQGDGGWEDMIRTITATWVKQQRFTGRGTIWAWGTPSANFGYQNFSMFYAVLGMPASFRKFMGRKIRVLGKHVRPDSDYVIPSLEDGWNAICHVEDGKAWEPIDPSLWQEINDCTI